MVRVKVCGLTTAEDVAMAVNEGADAIGFVFEPTSPRYVGDRHYSTLIKLAGPYVTTVAVFGHQTRSVQDVSAVQAIIFSQQLAGKHRIQTIRLRDGQLPESLQMEADVSAVHFDAYSDSDFGGTGQKVDWDLAAELKRRLDEQGLPVILAGGLTPGNVAEAIAKVKPYAVDVSSGVELSPGKKDVYKVRDFIAAAKSALL